jgi:hypothetical protein
MAWAATHARLTPAECFAIVAGTIERLEHKYDWRRDALRAPVACPRCAYPVAGAACNECATVAA